MEKKNEKAVFYKIYKDLMTDKRRKVPITFDKYTAANRKLAIEYPTKKITEKEGAVNINTISRRLGHENSRVTKDI